MKFLQTSILLLALILASSNAIGFTTNSRRTFLQIPKEGPPMKSLAKL